MIEAKAKELGRLIGQSPEYKELKRANDTLSEDHESVALLKQMEQLRREAHSMLERDERPTENMENQLDTLLSQIQSKPSYQRIVSAQANFDKIMSRVNDWILEGIEKGASSPIITLG